jgi:NodT family efflux transporter outer membrane factor (OMF) lipoprotein
MSLSSRRFWASTALASLLCGCTMGPDFEKPTSWSPDHWFETPPAAELPIPTTEPTKVVVAEPLDTQWWTLFGDAELTSLETRAASANLDVKAAAIRLAESREQRRIVNAEDFPQVNGDASYTRERPSSEGIFGLLGGGGGAAPQGANSIPSKSTGLNLHPFNLWQYGFDASWELDLWGKIRRSIEAADASIEALAYAQRATLVSLEAEVARDYVTLRAVQTELRIEKENLDSAKDSQWLTQQRNKAGLASDLDVANASAQVASTGADIPQLEQRQAETINQLNFLLGVPPGSLDAELLTPAPVPPVPPRAPIGLPSELAHRRPDIRQAEAQLHAQTAQIGVAEANFYPSVTLTGSFDLQALHLANLADWGAHTYTFGPSISIPIFQGGKLSGNLELTKAQAQEAAVAYQRTVLNAWTEIASSLADYSAEQRRRVQLAEVVQQNRRSLDLARRQYTQGLTTFLDVLTAQRALLAGEVQEAESNATVSTNLVALYKALGGGWETVLPEKTAEASTP